ncbi:DeoR/GlpR family DNA-binding transcription regulator [Vreelandella olivaria]|uniref:DeoR/GlpR family DNA-binding transcription regulator n=1 Tax=Vreelandella olivaria TaxID=390919 RepID=UPI00201E9620|nr:DeoR/GlpR family DNA-binding transcription regulator [Halomonas olivaria]
MWHHERHQRICSLINTFNQLSTEKLASELGVSKETVRRDLLHLEAVGELQRIHGGAISVNKEEPPINIRSKLHVNEKKSMVKLARSQIKSGQTLFVDAGSTTTLLAEELNKLSGLIVITNSWDVAYILESCNQEEGASGSNQVILLGGKVNPQLKSTFGQQTVSEIHTYRADMALLSPVGIEATFGASSYDHDEAAVAQAMVNNADKVLLLADHSKIGKVSRVSYCPTKRVDFLISDQPINDALMMDALHQSAEVLTG